MDRRHVLKGIGVVALYGSFPTVLSEFLSSCDAQDKALRPVFFSDNELSILEQVCDILLPRTATPGALDVRLPDFIDAVVKDCMSKDDQQLIKNGLLDLNNDKSGKSFSSLNEEEKKERIKTIDENAFREGSSNPWFRIVKKLAVIGYFTSQEGMTKALRYVKVPGDYKACVPYKPGEKALAKTFLMYY